MFSMIIHCVAFNFQTGDGHLMLNILLPLSFHRKVNIMDTMVIKLEKYANNLEEIVDKRTDELLQEKKKTDDLLYRMLPR